MTDTALGKECKDCGVWKSVDDFYYARDGKLGRHARCKPCHKVYAKAHRKPVPYEKVRTQQIARQKARLAYRRGRLPRSLRCHECGRPTRDTQAHHEDYSKPLDVTWLCPECHRAKHWQFQRGSRTREAAAA